jgi:hypothetical protein
MVTLATSVKRSVGKRVSNRRRAQRDALWPDASDAVFQTAGGGWSQTPRVVPMVASLIDSMGGGKESAGRVYAVLWSYEYGDGFVTLPDAAQLALEAGYLTNRAERTFSERVETLRALGFIRTKAVGLRDVGFILLLDPHAVVSRLRHEKPDLVPDRWWTAFVSRCSEIGVQLAPQAVGASAT